MSKPNGNGTNRKPRQNRKPRSNNRKPSSKRESYNDRDEELPKGDRDNDPNWYFTDALLAEQTSELSMQQILGDGITFEEYSAPTIMAIGCNPCPGPSVTANAFLEDTVATDTNWSYSIAGMVNDKDGINLAATKLYTLMSGFTGRATTAYGPQDIAMIILAVSSLSEAFEHVRRAFGVALTYNPRNRSLPRDLVESMGFDAQDLFDNLADYRTQFNSEVVRINQIPLLDNIGFIRKSREMYQHVYVDEPSSMAQIFFYRPASLWILNEEGETGTQLDETWPNDSYYGAVLTVRSWLQKIHTMITALLESTTLNTIYADMINLSKKIAYPTWQFDLLAENYVVMPMYDANAVLQLHNLTIVGRPMEFDTDRVTVLGFDFTTGNAVYQDPSTNSVVYNPAFPRDNGLSYAHKVIVDFDNDQPTLVDRIEALRYKTCFTGWVTKLKPKGEDNQILAWSFTPLPDHYATDVQIWDGNTDSSNPAKYCQTETVSNGLTSSSWATMQMTEFKHHPLVYVTKTTSTESRIKHILGELNFWTLIDSRYLTKVNRVVYQGLFDFRI